MKNTNKIARIIARRQKRLLYWRERYDGVNLSSEQNAEISILLASYNSALSDYLLAESDEKLSQIELDLDNLERQLVERFESRRLMTSKIGIPAVEDC